MQQEYSPQKLVSELLDHIQDVSNETSSVHDSHSKAVDIAQLSLSYHENRGSNEELDMNRELPVASSAAEAEEHVPPAAQPPAPGAADAGASEQQYWAFTEDAETVKRNFEMAKALESHGCGADEPGGDAQGGAVPVSPVAEEPDGAEGLAGAPSASGPAAGGGGGAALHDVSAAADAAVAGRHMDPGGVNELDDRSAQEAYAKKVGGLELYSEDEVHHQLAVARAAHVEADDEVLTAINAIMSEQGGEGRRMLDGDASGDPGDSPR